MKLESINPYTNSVIEEFEEFSDKKVYQVIEIAEKAFDTWKHLDINNRLLLLSKVAETLLANKDIYAYTITAEMGKPIKESRAEIEKCAWVCSFYAENAQDMLKPQIIKTDATLSRVQFEPLGTILGIMPWNFPFWQAFRFIAPSLAVGNTVLIKHSSNVQGCARHIEQVFLKAGLPEGIVQNLVIRSGKVASVINKKSIKAVTLTGSGPAGASVASEAGRNIKKSVLELGGNNAFVVFEDADIDKAVETGITARMQNGGQSCIAAKRFIIHSQIAETFVKKLKEKVKSLKVGDPREETTDIGPLSSIEQAAEVEEQVDKSVHLGAKSEFLVRRWHATYFPVILTQVKPGMPVFDEEVFGPVLAVTEFNDEKEAIELVNKSEFGLGVSLFTKDIERAERIIPQINDGAVFVNALVKSDPRLPFGGTKNSGYGRELSSFGLLEFTNIKTIYIVE